MAKRYTVDFNAKIKPVKPLNEEFTLCKCYVMALDKNRNLSFIGRDAADAALPTLFNIPVIGHLYVDDEGKYHMGGHDSILAQDENGNLIFKSMCVPYGVVPQQDSVSYEDIKEPNGDVHTYMVADVILWTGRFPELYEAVYNEDIYFGQSMEINVSSHKPLEEDKNYTDITAYSYSALCLLGKSDNPEFHTEPCFPISRVEPYEFSVDDKFSELMSQLKDELALCFDSDAGKKGEGMEDTINTITEPAVDAVDTATAPENDVPDTTDTTQTQEFATEPTAPETPENGADDNGTTGEFTNAEPETTVVEFDATYIERRDALENALPEICEHDEEGHHVRSINYWICDFTETEVYVERHEWTRAEGCKESKGRFAYEFVDADKTAHLTSEFVEMFIKWLTKEEVAQIEAMRKNYEELVEYKNKREKADREAEFDAVISGFAYLSEIEEYQTVYANRYSYETTKALEDACYIIKGKYSVAAPQQRRTNTEPSVPIGDKPAPASLHERFHERYGHK